MALLFGPALLAGCATDPDDSSPDDDAEKRTVHGWVVVERAEGVDRVRTNVSAKFVHVADDDADAAKRLVGARPSIPASGECVALGELEDAAALSDFTPGSTLPASSVELVDVGDVTLSIHEDDAMISRVVLAPRAFPDIADLVSGVFYTTPDASLGLRVPADYAIGGTGSFNVEAFEINVRAPEAPRGLIIAGKDIDAAADDDGPDADLVEVKRGLDIELAWAPGVDTASLVYVDIVGAQSHRCTFPDGGGAVLPAEVLTAADAVATINLHRLTERNVVVVLPAGATGEDLAPQDATVVFDLSRSVRLDVR